MQEFEVLTGNTHIGEVTVFERGKKIPASTYVWVDGDGNIIPNETEDAEAMWLKSAVPFYGCNEHLLVSLGVALYDDAKGKHPVTYDFHWRVPYRPGTREQMSQLLGSYRAAKLLEAFGKLGVVYGGEFDNVWYAGNADFPNVPQGGDLFGAEYVGWKRISEIVARELDDAIRKKKNSGETGEDILARIRNEVPPNTDYIVGYLVDNSIPFSRGELENEVAKGHLSMNGRVYEVVNSYIEGEYEKEIADIETLRSEAQKKFNLRRVGVGLSKK